MPTTFRLSLIFYLSVSCVAVAVYPVMVQGSQAVKEFIWRKGVGQLCVLVILVPCKRVYNRGFKYWQYKEWLE